MALESKTNQATGSATATALAVTGVGFQPKALLIWSGLQQSAGATADAQLSLGFASTTSDERSGGYNSVDNAATADLANPYNQNNILYLTQAGTSTAETVANLTSLGADGFTLTWSTVVTNLLKYNYLALGGADITNAVAGKFDGKATTGTTAVTGLGFMPDVVIFFSVFKSSSGNGVSRGRVVFSFGVADDSGSQWSVSTRSAAGFSSSDTARAFSDSSCIQMISEFNEVVEESISLVSMDADGFTVNTDVASGFSTHISYLAIKGGRWKVGTETQKTSTGTKATTGVGFTPSGVLFASTGGTTNGSVDNHSKLCIGATTGASNNVSQWVGDRDASADTVAATLMKADKCLVMATETVGDAPTEEALAELDTFNSDGFTLDWTTADGTARKFGYLAWSTDGVTAHSKNLTDSISATDVNTTSEGSFGEYGNTYFADAYLEGSFSNLLFSKLVIKAPTDTATISEVLRRAITDSFTDSATISEALLKAWSTARTLTDSSTVSDTLTKTPGKSRSDSATISEAFTLATTFRRTLTDSFAAASNLLKSVLRQVADSSTITDTLTLIQTLFRTLTDTATMTDEKLTARATTFSDNSTLSESITKSSTKLLNDEPTLTDLLAIGKSFLRTYTDSAVVEDLIESVKFIGASLTDSTTASDSIVKRPGKSLLESTIASDTVTRELTFGRTLTDTATMSESFSIGYLLFLILSDVFTPTDVNQQIDGSMGEFGNTYFGEGALGDEAAIIYFSKKVSRTFIETPVSVTDAVIHLCLNGFTAIWSFIGKAAASAYTKVAKPSSSFTKAEKPSSSFTKEAKPEVTFTKSAKPTTTWSKIDKQDDC